MDVTKEDREKMCEVLDKGLDMILKQEIDMAINDHIILPIGIYLACNRSMISEIYKIHKSSGRKIYFKNKEGLWLLDSKGEITLRN